MNLRHLACLLVAIGSAALVTAQPAGAPLILNPGDRIAIIGNGLGDRMQHHGSLETLIHASHPGHELVVRNLAVSADELTIRARSMNFGTPNEWLSKVGADVILAFFGFNESFEGPDGLNAFKEALDRFLNETRAQNYSGNGPPRIVLFSPIANERHPNPDVYVPEENNRNLALYAQAMAEVVRDRAGITFVDLFAPSQQLFAEAAQQNRALTHNGIHLTEEGDATLAPAAFQAIFRRPPPAGDFSRLRNAVNEKSEMWHSRYRTVDGYNVYGGRSSLAFPSAEEGERITNFDVMQEEMVQRDVLTANRDRRIWAVARGGDLALEDTNLPAVTAVPTNRPGPNPDGSYPFLSGEEAIAKMTVHPGLKVNLFASEEEFPFLANPVQMAWDTRGRLWVATWPNYPSRQPTSEHGDRLIILEDTNGDGRADRQTVFLDDLNCPTGFQFYKDGVIIVQSPDAWFVRDTDGDGRADWREIILTGLDSADSHHASNSIAYEPGGAIYFSDGVFHRSSVETSRGPVRNIDGAIFRYEPRTHKFETYVSYDFANPHGRTFDRWGNDLITDATGNYTYFGPAFSGRIDYPQKHPRMQQIWQRPARPSAGGLIMTTRHFPDDYQGNFINGNVIGFQGFYRVQLSDEDSGIRGDRLGDILSSSDPNFRPLEINIGPDGALYFLDWHNPIIGHMQHHLRDPNRDGRYGRIYRITAEGRPLLVQPTIHDQPVPALLELLKEPENHVRQLAKVELDRHDSAAVIAELNRWIARLDRNHPDYQHHLTEALWVHQWHNVVDENLLRRQLRSPNANARAAATRVLCYWHDRVPAALDLLLTQSRDEHPRVRLQAARAASFFRDERAIDIALNALTLPLDYYLEYTIDETIKQLRPHWLTRLSNPASLAAMDPVKVDRLLRATSVDQLRTLPATNEVLDQLVKRTGVPEIVRNESLLALARSRGVTPAAALTDILTAGGDIDEVAVGRLLTMRPADELQAIRTRLESLASSASAGTRPYVRASAIVASQSFDQAWGAATTTEVRSAFLEAIPLIPDSALRARSFDLVMPLLTRSASRPDGAVDPDSDLQPAAIRAVVSTRREPAAVFNVLARKIARLEQLPIAAQGIRSLPQSEWNPTAVTGVVETLVTWANGMPNRLRNQRDYLETVQTADALLVAATPADATRLRTELRSLRVARHIIRAVPEEMRYDNNRIVVEAGRPFQLVFDNPDVMPHNVVVLKPGARERIGNLAMTMLPDQLDSAGRSYVPGDPDILGATRMLEFGQTETLNLTAPTVEGVYEFVCTFPGHWMVMYGQLIVTTDPDTYREQNPPALTVTPPAPAVHHGTH